MGLDTTHNCWHGPYSSFGSWRCSVGQAAGYPLTHVNVLGYTLDAVGLGRDYGEEGVSGRWKATPADPLVVLLAHSDCNGIIQVAQAEPLASALSALLPKLGELDREYAQSFIAGLRAAAAAGEDVEFR